MAQAGEGHGHHHHHPHEHHHVAEEPARAAAHAQPASAAEEVGGLECGV